MELSDDEDDSNYCTPEIESFRIVGRTVSNPIPRNEFAEKSHSNGSGMDSRLKSPSASDIEAVEMSGDKDGMQSVSMVTDREKTGDAIVNGGTYK